ncbi:hypothetical protein J31TS4_17470 [Paenibacillus sp. J31TS4]|uniref:DUF4855 domain-containing protein n=1 Tax=Paenibacillus sp. J31TS4 TaxID=2807195 RepID=UPI001B2EF711|nr:DUF4855 domain-containing protein [Paenibacillus sp. J31TS4]GIP38467.1 hypothetical protein J31TS4_17470 [Paenibacillus sp. J31TS4]
MRKRIAARTGIAALAVTLLAAGTPLAGQAARAAQEESEAAAGGASTWSGAALPAEGTAGARIVASGRAAAGAGQTDGAPAEAISAGSTVEGRQNLALHKSVTVSQPNAVFDTIQGIGLYGKETPLANAGMLTDGRYGDTSNWQNSADWFVSYRKLKREVVVDLERIQTVNELAMGFGQRNDVGIAPPVGVRYYVSNDGTDYRYLGKAAPDAPLYFAYTPGANDMHRKTYRLDKLADGTPLHVQARYVKAVFVVNFFGWTDEFEVFGQEGIANGAVLPESQPDSFEPGEYGEPGTAETANIRDQFLWYSGPMAEQSRELTNWTKDKAAAVLGYRDIYGTDKDWFFDDLLAIPVTAMVTPSGLDASGNARYVTKEDMLTFLDFILKPDTQLGAVNEAARELNRKLGTDRKVRINLSIPMIETSANFGDITGDGSRLPLRPEDFASRVSNPSSYEGRLEMSRLAFENKKAAVCWYIDEAERRFREMGYDQLRLDSFYWYHERIDETTGEAELVQATAKYLKDKNYFFTWIPYIGPGSAYQWRDLGFTTASIQPGFAFGNSKKAIFPAVAELARTVGGSLEIEYDDYRTLAQYLNYGVREGYMTEASNTYYMAAMPLVDGAYAFTPLDPAKTPDSLSAIRRSVYDRTYEYVKGRYQERYTMTLVPNVADKARPSVALKLPLADGFVSGRFDVHYDASKAAFESFAVPAALQGKGTFEARETSPGTVNVTFSITDPASALSSDLITKRNPLDGAPELLTLQFAKKDGTADAAITSRLFTVDDRGEMRDAAGKTYRGWGYSDLTADTPEAQLVESGQAVKQAETTLSKEDIQRAQFLVTKLPNSPIRDAWMDRVKAARDQSHGK